MSSFQVYEYELETRAVLSLSLFFFSSALLLLATRVGGDDLFRLKGLGQLLGASMCNTIVVEKLMTDCVQQPAAI